VTAFNSYSAGTVSVAANATVVIGVGTAWGGINAKPGDDIVIAGHTVIIIDVTDPTHLVIDPWPYTAVSAGSAYKIFWRSPLRYVGGQAMADVDTLIQTLANGIFPTINGGTAASSTLTLQSTSGVGTTDAIVLKTGSQVERLKIDSAGEITETNNSSGAVGAILSMYHNKTGTPAVADRPALQKFYGNNSVALKTEYAELASQILQTTSGNEYGCITGQVKVNGVLSDSLLSGQQTFILGYCNPASNNFEYVFRAPTGKVGYMYMESFDSGTVGPSYNLWHNKSGGAANNDICGYFTSDANNSSGVEKHFFELDVVVIDKTAGSEDGEVRISTIAGGVVAERLRLNNTALIVNGVTIDNQPWTTTAVTLTAVTPGGTAPTIALANVRWKQVGKTIVWTLDWRISANGTGSNALRVTNMPFTPSQVCPASGYNPGQGIGTAGQIDAGTTILTFFHSDGSYPGYASGVGVNNSISGLAQA
jgi:hypothetical protein